MKNVHVETNTITLIITTTIITVEVIMAITTVIFNS